MSFYSKFGELTSKIFIFCILFMSSNALADKPIASDSRIKVFVYNEYEVFRLTFHYGHHAHVDFSKGEFVKSISIGDNSNWYAEPVGSSLFIQPQEKGIYTNMTVVTNKRTYEFDLVSKDPTEFGLNADRDLIYVVKFFYPEEISTMDSIQGTADGYSSTGFNYNSPFLIRDRYSFVGSRDIAPEEVFDDGSLTYMRFSKFKAIPDIFTVKSDGRRERIKTTPYKDYLVLDTIAPKFVLKRGGKTVEVFNDN